MNPNEGNRDSRLLVGAVGLSAGGDFLALVPLAALVSELSGSGWAVSGLFVALWGPMVLFSSPAGKLIDRVETRGLLIISSLVQAVIAAALILVTDSVGAIIALTALLGSVNAFSAPAEFALTGSVASGERLKLLNGHVETARYMGMAIGPIVGGALAGAGGIEIALAINALTFAAVAVAAWMLTVRRRPTPTHTDEAHEVRGGFEILGHDPVLRLMMWVTFVTLFLMTGVATAEVFYVREDLDGGDFGYGAVLTAWTLGMAAGALLISSRIGATSLASAAMVMIMVQGAGLSVQTIALSLPLAIVCYLVGGIGHGTKNVLVRTLIHERTPANAHGRSGAAYNALRNGAELGALALGGYLVEAIGARGTLAIQGAAPILVALAGLAILTFRLQGGPSAEPEPIGETMEDEATAPTAPVRGEMA
jgi:MFS family permease